MKKPLLDLNISVEELNAFYWSKNELVDFCKVHKIPYTGAKHEILERISIYVTKGEIIKPEQKNNCKSTFDWNYARLTSDTVITDNYKSTENVRDFFLDEVGPNFKFYAEFINWIKSNTGKTLGDAAIEWQNIWNLKRDKNYKTIIPPQYEFKLYVRDFLEDFPNKKITDAINSWKTIREKSGSRKYSKQNAF